VKCDVVVIGGGVAGVASAYQLAKNGMSVFLLESEARAGYHSTSRAVGLFSENFSTHGIMVLSKMSRPFFESIPHDCRSPHSSASSLLEGTGLISVSSPGAQRTLLDRVGPPGESKRLLNPMDKARAASVRVVSSAHGNRVHPYLNWSALGSWAMLEDNARVFDANGVLSALVQGSKFHKASLRFGEKITGIQKQPATGKWMIESEKKTSVSDASPLTTYECDFVVNASGAWADHTAAMAGIKPIGIKPMRRSVFTFKAKHKRVGHEIDVAHDSFPVRKRPGTRLPYAQVLDENGVAFYLSPLGEEGLFFGSPANRDPEEPGDCKIQEDDTQRFLDRLDQYTNFEVEKMDHCWAGHRVYSPDGNMVIGPDGNDESFIWFAALKGQGINVAPGAAEWLSHLMCEETLPPYLREVGFDAKELLPIRFKDAVDPAGMEA
jgi:D-arginine dehydrogenase